MFLTLDRRTAPGALVEGVKPLTPTKPHAALQEQFDLCLKMVYQTENALATPRTL